jgi:hypothetical protein
MILGVWTDDGFSWGPATFLAVWAGAVLYVYVAGMGAVASFGEIRIAKTADSGEIFTGIGRMGRTHRLLWSDFSSVGYKDHYVGLNGTSKEYKFGSDLNRQQQAFVIAFLRQHLFAKNVGQDGILRGDW